MTHPNRYVPTTAIEKPCERCQAPIVGMPSEIARRKFCSRECGNAARKGVRKTVWASMPCHVCGAIFETFPAWVRNGRRKYCGSPCRAKANEQNKNRLGKAHSPESRAKMSAGKTGQAVGPLSSQWKGGRYLSKGYAFVMVDLLPAETQALVRQMVKGRYVAEHRAVGAALAGRPLTVDDVVHHINGEKTDNRPENLAVTPRADHTREHREFERKFRRLQIEVENLRAENAALRSRLT